MPDKVGSVARLPLTGKLFELAVNSGETGLEFDCVDSPTSELPLGKRGASKRQPLLRARQKRRKENYASVHQTRIGRGKKEEYENKTRHSVATKITDRDRPKCLAPALSYLQASTNYNRKSVPCQV